MPGASSPERGARVEKKYQEELHEQERHSNKKRNGEHVLPEVAVEK